MTSPAASPSADRPPSDRPSGPRSAGPRRRPGEFGGGGRKFTPRRKVCAFCVDKIKEVDYKDLARLRRFLSERGKIEPRRKTGTCAAHQRSLNVALKRARELAMLPFTAEHIRVTGVLVREPGAAPFRGGRGPRMPDTDGVAPEAPPANSTSAEAAAPAPDGGTTPAAAPPEVTAAAPAETVRAAAPAETGIAAAPAEAAPVAAPSAPAEPASTPEA